MIETMGGKLKGRGEEGHQRMRPKAVLWDMDGTLVDSERENAKHLAGALVHNFDLKIDNDDRQFIIGKSWVDIHENLNTKYQAYKWSLAQLIEGVNHHIESQGNPQKVRVLPGALSLLEMFALAQIPMAVVTGSSRAEAKNALNHFRVLKECPLFAAEDVPTSKPDPLGYQMAAERLGVETSSCLVFEDSEVGIAAAKSAGCRVVAVREGNFSSQDQSAAHVVIDSLESVNWLKMSYWMGQKKWAGSS